MDYKDTLLLPKTDFPMRGNLSVNEPIRYEKWFNNGTYDNMKKSREGAPLFTLHDGPPYANGNLHIGHALNKILKDIIVKMNYFSGKDIRFTTGWDCHGLPIEQQVEKKLGGKDKKDELSVVKVRELCRDHAREFVGIQKDEFKKLGVVADFDNSYLSMDYNFEADIYRLLCDIAKGGFLVERSKPVYWSWAERTALAEAEIEYKDKVSPSIYLSFELKSGEYRGNKLVIWTTTPWTIPSNVALAIGEDIEYSLTTDGYIVAKSLHSTLVSLGVISGEIISSVEKDKLVGRIAVNPLNKRDSKVIFGYHVKDDGGTGVVHIAPGHGEDDYYIALEYDLEVIMPVDEFGHYNSIAIDKSLFPSEISSDLDGIFIFKANKIICEYLMNNKTMLKQDELTHSYPHCWRSKKPIIFRATKQWFISMNNELKLKESSINSLNSVNFYPQRAKNRLLSAVSNRPDWCISRQRSWGVPIAFLKEISTKKPLFDKEVLNHIYNIFKEFGSDVWYSEDVSYFLPKESSYDASKYEKVKDILDVWFDSGSSWNSVINSSNYDAGNYPADLYIEGSDQHRGWFQSSLILSSAIDKKSPYKNLITHGFTVDGKGEKMSKSKGNVVSLNKVVKQYGSEVLRLWVALSDYTGDLKISDDILKQMADNYKKIRNTFRFLLANINDLKSPCKESELKELELWIYNEARDVFNEVNKSFQNYDYSKGLNILNNFLVNDLSGLYLDICKDRLYCDSKDSLNRNSSQSVMYYILRSMIETLAPILTYTVDEVIEYSKGHFSYDSVFDITNIPLKKISEPSFDVNFFKQARNEFLLIVDDLKKNRGLKNTLELNIFSTSNKIKDLSKVNIEDWFLVSNFSEGEVITKFNVDNEVFYISYSRDEKCERCWKLNAPSSKLCSRCSSAIQL